MGLLSAPYKILTGWYLGVFFCRLDRIEFFFYLVDNVLTEFPTRMSMLLDRDLVALAVKGGPNLEVRLVVYSFILPFSYSVCSIH